MFINKKLDFSMTINNTNPKEICHIVKEVEWDYQCDNIISFIPKKFKVINKRDKDCDIIVTFHSLMSIKEDTEDVINKVSHSIKLRYTNEIVEIKFKITKIQFSG